MNIRYILDGKFHLSIVSSRGLRFFYCISNFEFFMSMLLNSVDCSRIVVMILKVVHFDFCVRVDGLICHDGQWKIISPLYAVFLFLLEN
jgi:hypothetical protein